MSGFLVKAIELTEKLISFFEQTRKKRRYPFLNDKGDIIKPFPCASCDYELICSNFEVFQNNGASIEFDFSKAKLPVDRLHFVSIVYKFPAPISLRRYNMLKFSLLIENGTFDQVDVEMKSSNGSLDKNPVLTCCKGTDSIHEIAIQHLRKNIIDDLCEICFVVKVKPGDIPDTYKGKFTIKHISFQ